MKFGTLVAFRAGQPLRKGATSPSTTFSRYVPGKMSAVCNIPSTSPLFLSGAGQIRADDGDNSLVDQINAKDE